MKERDWDALIFPQRPNEGRETNLMAKSVTGWCAFNCNTAHTNTQFSSRWDSIRNYSKISFIFPFKSSRGWIAARWVTRWMQCIYFSPAFSLRAPHVHTHTLHKNPLFNCISKKSPPPSMRAKWLVKALSLKLSERGEVEKVIAPEMCSVITALRTGGCQGGEVGGLLSGVRWSSRTEHLNGLFLWEMSFLLWPICHFNGKRSLSLAIFVSKSLMYPSFRSLLAWRAALRPKLF